MPGCLPRWWKTNMCVSCTHHDMSHVLVRTHDCHRHAHMTVTDTHVCTSWYWHMSRASLSHVMRMCVPIERLDMSMYKCDMSGRTCWHLSTHTHVHVSRTHTCDHVVVTFDCTHVYMHVSACDAYVIKYISMAYHMHMYTSTCTYVAVVYDKHVTWYSCLYMLIHIFKLCDSHSAHLWHILAV